MDIGTHKVWQVAAGDTNRNYADLCLNWDVILNGPGSEGPWPDCCDSLSRKWGLSQRKLSDIRRFAEEMEDGDIVLLRIGTADVLGVGVVVGGYSHNEEFGDVDGWDLQHLRRVRWVWNYKDRCAPERFDTYSLKWGDTVQRLDSPKVMDWLKSLSVSDADLDRPLVELPRPSRDLSIAEISEYLFDRGIAGDVIKSLMERLKELILIARWYRQTNVSPSENETIAHLVVPLLRALGWTPQKMAVEWNNVYVALFKALPRSAENLSVVFEVKRKDHSCLTAVSQAQYYATQPENGKCDRLIVTDGVRYGVFSRNEGKFRGHPHAYLNITRLREDYPVYNFHGAKDAFLYLSADWNRG